MCITTRRACLTLFPLPSPDFASPNMPQSAQISLQRPSTGTPELQVALDSFKTSLNDQQRQELDSLSAHPDAAAVLQFTTLLDEKNAARRSRCIAARVHTVLACIQQFTTVVDTFVSSNPNIAALLWGSVKLTLLVSLFNQPAKFSCTW